VYGALASGVALTEASAQQSTPNAKERFLIRRWEQTGESSPNTQAPHAVLVKIDNAICVLQSRWMAKQALGRGLGALMGGISGKSPAPTPAAPAAIETAPAKTPPGEQIQRVPVSKIRPCPFQPRRDFTEETLKELADSIREQGILQPLVVRSRDGGFELIAGERRWRAAQLAGLAELPVLVREADDR